MRNEFSTLALSALAVLFSAAPLYSQQQNVQQPNAAVFGPNLGFGANGGGQNNGGNSGGAASADFDSLIDLIQSTVAQETWADTGGGEAEIRPFPTGVMVDAAGTLKVVKTTPTSPALANQLESARPITPHALATDAIRSAADPRRASKLRYVSLPRLEREIIRRQDAHEPFDPSLLTLAGLQRIEYIFVVPAGDNGTAGDLVLAGPAGDWRIDRAGRILAADTGAPIVRLDDLLTLIRRASQSKSTFFGCAINPRPAALAATQAVLDKSAARPLEPSRRQAWLEEIRATLGRQDVEIFGIDSTSRVARVMVEADVHMKLVGMGLEDGVPGVENYLDSVKNSGQPPAAMAVLRWWFALRYAAIRISPDGDAYQLVGDGACVLSENEALAAQGQRVHTGQSDPLNQQFADSFTNQFAALAKKYPVYAELRTIFDLSLALALIETDSLAARAHWQPTRFLDNEKLRLPNWPTPREVDTVANCVVANRRQIIAGVSGGVMVDTQSTMANRTVAESLLNSDRLATRSLRHLDSTAAPAAGAISWWWDAAH